MRAFPDRRRPPPYGLATGYSRRSPRASSQPSLRCCSWPGEQLIECVLSLELDHVDLELLLGGRGLSPELVEPWVGGALGGLPHVDEVSGAAPTCASVTVDADGHGVSPWWIDEFWNHETRQSHRCRLPRVASHEKKRA